MGMKIRFIYKYMSLGIKTMPFRPIQMHLTALHVPAFRSAMEIIKKYRVE